MQTLIQPLDQARHVQVAGIAICPCPGESDFSGESAEDFGPGDRVRHKSFGEGAVVVVEGDKLAVDFDEGGLKTLLIGYAPIEKVV